MLDFSHERGAHHPFPELAACSWVAAGQRRVCSGAACALASDGVLIHTSALLPVQVTARASRAGELHQWLSERN
jgi:hypothetical protein